MSETPNTWECRPLWTTIHGQVNGTWGDEALGDSNDIICVRVADFDRVKGRVAQHNLTIRNISGRDRSGRDLAPGDLLLEKSGGGELQPVGKVVLYDLPIPAVSSNFIARMRPTTDHDPGFLCYLHESLYTRRLNLPAIRQSTGIQNLDARQYLRQKVAVPPRVDQVRIRDFLDRRTSRIDDLIEKKEELIFLLNEQRTAIITQAVTKGLNPLVPMKDSGVDWLGEVPVHWRTKPLKRTADFINGIAFKPEEWGNEGTPIIRIENLNNPEAPANCTLRTVDQRFHVQAGDLLFGWSGNRGTSFGPFVWKKEGLHYLNQHIFKIANFEFDKRWFYWVLVAVTHFVERQAHGIIGMVHITRSELGTIHVPEISPEEQRAIASHVDERVSELDSLVSLVRQGISRLREYRSALITAAVTGQIGLEDGAV